MAGTGIVYHTSIPITLILRGRQKGNSHMQQVVKLSLIFAIEGPASAFLFENNLFMLLQKGVEYIKTV